MLFIYFIEEYFNLEINLVMEPKPCFLLQPIPARLTSTLLLGPTYLQLFATLPIVIVRSLSSSFTIFDSFAASSIVTVPDYTVF